MITISYNDNEEMMEITYNDRTIFYGNYWDFDDSPHGLKKLFEKLDLDVQLSEDLKGENDYINEDDYQDDWFGDDDDMDDDY